LARGRMILARAARRHFAKGFVYYYVYRRWPVVGI
jgi:hypothetical protein